MREIETEYRNRLAHQCSTEKAHKQRRVHMATTMEARAQAKTMSLPHCDDFEEKFGGSAGSRGRGGAGFGGSASF